MKKPTLILIVFLISALCPRCVIDGHNQPGVRKTTWAVPHEYLDLFTKQTRKQFSENGYTTFEMKSGLKTSSVIYIYESHGNAYGYLIELFKIGLKEDKPLNQILLINQRKVLKDVDTGFIRLRSGGFDLKYKDGSTNGVSKVVINFNGALLQLNSSRDNLLYYDVDFNNFSITYDNGSEFWAHKTSSFFSHEYGKLIFLKKDKALYTIFISDNGSEPFSKRDTVLSLLKPDLTGALKSEYDN